MLPLSGEVERVGAVCGERHIPDVKSCVLPRDSQYSDEAVSFSKNFCWELVGLSLCQ